MDRGAPLQAASTVPSCKDDQGSVHTAEAAPLLLAHTRHDACADPASLPARARGTWWLHQEETFAVMPRTSPAVLPASSSPIPALFWSLPQGAAHLHHQSPSPRFPFIPHPSFYLLSPNSSEDVLLYLLSCKIYTN